MVHKNCVDIIGVWGYNFASGASKKIWPPTFAYLDGRHETKHCSVVIFCNYDD